MSSLVTLPTVISHCASCIMIILLFITQEDIALVQDQLSVNREEVASLQSELNHQQGLTAEAENISEQWERDCEAARQQVNITCFKNKIE